MKSVFYLFIIIVSVNCALAQSETNVNKDEASAHGLLDIKPYSYQLSTGLAANVNTPGIVKNAEFTALNRIEFRRFVPTKELKVQTMPVAETSSNDNLPVRTPDPDKSYTLLIWVPK